MINRAIATIGLALAIATPAFAQVLDWQFLNNTASGILPQVGGQGSPTATVSTTPISGGGLSAGWGNTWGLGSPVPNVSGAGHWDLGQNGTISLTGLGNVQAGSQLTVVEWYDGGIFNGGLKANSASASSGPSQVTPVGTGPGQWMQYEWSLASISSGSLTIQDPGSGAIVGRVELTYVPEPYQYGLASLLGMVVLAGREALRRRKLG